MTFAARVAKPARSWNCEKPIETAPSRAACQPARPGRARRRPRDTDVAPMWRAPLSSLHGRPALRGRRRQYCSAVPLEGYNYKYIVLRQRVEFSNVLYCTVHCTASIGTAIIAQFTDCRRFVGGGQPREVRGFQLQARKRALTSVICCGHLQPDLHRYCSALHGTSSTTAPTTAPRQRRSPVAKSACRQRHALRVMWSGDSELCNSVQSSPVQYSAHHDGLSGLIAPRAPNWNATSTPRHHDGVSAPRSLIIATGPWLEGAGARRVTR